MITYKGYTALLEVDVPSGEIVGHAVGIHDEIVFTGKTTEEAIAGFHGSVDFYLGRLAEAGQEPERPFSGRFNVRIDSETHRRLVLDSESRKESLNEVVRRAFASYLESAARAEDADATIPTGDDRVASPAKRDEPEERAARAAAKRTPSKSGA